MRRRSAKALVILAGNLVFSLMAISQTSIKIPLWFTDESGLFTWSDSLRFGVHPAATPCIDDALGEFFMFTECGLFSQHCAQFGRPPYSPCDEGDFPVFLDLRPFSSGSQTDTFAVGFVGTYPITLHWPSSISQFFDSARVVDGLSFVFGLPQRLNVDMMATDSAVILNDTIGWYGLIILTHGPHVATAVFESSTIVPDVFSLSQNYPNPFNPSTTITYTIPVGTYGRTSLRVYDVLGREVATLVNEIQPPGMHSVEFSAAGRASGVYFYRLESGGFVETKRLVLLR